VSFGAKLSSDSQPSNAEGGVDCDENSGIPSGATCTWLSSEAYRNVGREKAPKDGRIARVRLVSCVAGSFVLQLARYRPATGQAKVTRNGPVIRYHADPSVARDGFCGGDDGVYQVQSYPVDVAVRKGERIAIKATRTGTLYCSGGGGVELYSPPLKPGGGFRSRSGDASCLMLVQLVYR
jgi:hypothetical protein